MYHSIVSLNNINHSNYYFMITQKRNFALFFLLFYSLNVTSQEGAIQFSPVIQTQQNVGSFERLLLWGCIMALIFNSYNSREKLSNIEEKCDASITQQLDTCHQVENVETSLKNNTTTIDEINSQNKNILDQNKFTSALSLYNFSQALYIHSMLGKNNNAFDELKKITSTNLSTLEKSSRNLETRYTNLKENNETLVREMKGLAENVSEMKALTRKTTLLLSNPGETKKNTPKKGSSEDHGEYFSKMDLMGMYFCASVATTIYLHQINCPQPIQLQRATITTTPDYFGSRNILGFND